MQLYRNFKKWRIKQSLILTVILSVIAAQSSAEKKIDRMTRGVPAELLNQGDYYIHPNGKRINFFRKKDIYALTGSEGKSAVSSAQMKQRSSLLFGENVEIVDRHNLGKVPVVRIKDAGVGLRIGQLKPNMLRSLDTSILSVEPVLANSRGSGDLLVTDRMTIKLNQNLGAQDLTNLLKQYGLSMSRRIRTSGYVYSVKSNRTRSVGERFALVRKVMSDARVDWAQPQFKSRPFKTAYQPVNNPLYTQQWHLQNTGKGGSRCDTDCDASNAWGIGVANGLEGAAYLSGAGSIIAVIDDGVQLDHEDLSIWSNPNESINGQDDDGNGYVDDISGWDFVDDDSSQAGSCGEDAVRGPDNDPSPQPFTPCTTVNGDEVDQDNHGTAVAGIAAAKNNNVGGVGSAYSSLILPIRLVSEFDADPNSDFCERAVEAMTYAGTYADVINNSWGMEEGTCPALDVVIEQIVDGTLANLNDVVEPRRSGLGSPVIFSSGNYASGWVKVTVPVKAGEHAYEWRFLRSEFPISDLTESDTVWLDDIKFPDGTIEQFEAGLGLFENACAVNTCVGCTPEIASQCKVWDINTNPSYSRSGSSAQIQMTNSQCIYSYLNTIKDGPAGDISFWVWVSTDQQIFSDKFEFLVDGKEVVSFGDLPNLIDDAVGYPANIDKVIAVGASDAGDLSGESIADPTAEERASYSQFGASLDLLAPSSNQHLGIVTTDRYGADGEGYNSSRDVGGSSVADPGYTDDFGGTSASAPIVSGVVAAMISANDSIPANGSISAAQIEAILRSTADKIGRRGVAAYDQESNTRSDFYGYGRVNMFRALKNILGVSDVDENICASQPFSYVAASDLILPSYKPQAIEFCPAKGPLPPDNSNCYVIRAKNSNVVAFCL